LKFVFDLEDFEGDKGRLIFIDKNKVLKGGTRFILANR
jgi:hypothetical protein